MAQRNWDKLGEAQRKRYERQGVSIHYYETGGRLNRFRGHRFEEHKTRRINNPLGLTATDYRFLKKQQIRNTKKSASKLVDFSGPIKAYKRMTPSQRTLLRERVSNDHREYKRQKSKSWRTAAEFKSLLSETYRGGGGGGAASSGGGGGAASSGGGGGGGGGGHYQDDKDIGGYDPGMDYEDPGMDYEEIDFETYEDDYPDFDDDLFALSLYH